MVLTAQHIENVHIEPFEPEEQFWNVYCRGAHSKFLSKAEVFVKRTVAHRTIICFYQRQI